MDENAQPLTGKDVHIAVPPAPEKGEQRKITKVRKGMGKAQYSTLITTVPAEICKQLGISPGDSLMWAYTPGNRVLSVVRIDSMLTDHTSFMYGLLDKLQTNSMDKGDREKIMKVKEILKDMGQVKELTKEEKEKEMKKIIKEHKEKK